MQAARAIVTQNDETRHAEGSGERRRRLPAIVADGRSGGKTYVEPGAAAMICVAVSETWAVG